MSLWTLREISWLQLPKLQGEKKLSHCVSHFYCELRKMSLHLLLGYCHLLSEALRSSLAKQVYDLFNPYPTAFPYGNGMVLHFYQQQESSTTKPVHKVINKGLKTYV